MRDNAKGGALTEVTFYILLSLYTPKHGYAVMQFMRPAAARIKFRLGIEQRSITDQAVVDAVSLVVQ